MAGMAAEGRRPDRKLRGPAVRRGVRAGRGRRRAALWAVLALLAGLIAVQGAAGATGAAAAGVIGDDYPAQGRAPVPMDSTFGNWGERNREWTSFVAWRLSSQNGFGMPFHRVSALPAARSKWPAEARTHALRNWEGTWGAADLECEMAWVAIDGPWSLEGVAQIINVSVAPPELANIPA